jgi:hypothetical protein
VVLTNSDSGMDVIESVVSAVLEIMNGGTP